MNQQAWHCGPGPGMLQLLLFLCASHAACYLPAPAVTFVRPIPACGLRRTPATGRQLRPVRTSWAPFSERAVSAGVLSALSTTTTTTAGKLNGVGPLDAPTEQIKRNSTHTETKARGDMSAADLAAFEAAKSADMGIRYDPLTGGFICPHILRAIAVRLYSAQHVLIAALTSHIVRTHTCTRSRGGIQRTNARRVAARPSNFSASDVVSRECPDRLSAGRGD